MAIKAADLSVVIGADTSEATRGIQGALGIIQQAGANALGYLTANVFNKIVSGFADMGREAFNSVASFESLGMTMQTLVARELRNTSDGALSMGDALDQAGGKTQELLDWIEKLAIESPYATSQVSDSFKQMLMYGFPIDQAKEMTQALLDMGAGSGMTSEQISGVSYALGQINLSDKLLMQDLRQLMNAGVDVNSILEEMGYDLGDVGTEAISSSDFIAKFIEVSDRDFGGAVDRMKGSWQGLTGALSDFKDIGLRELFSGAFDALKPLVQEFSDWLMGPGRDKLKELGNNLGELVSKVVDLGMSLAEAGPFSDEFREALGALSGRAGELYDKFAPILQNVFDWLVEHQSEIVGAITAIVVVFGGFTILSEVASLLSLVASPLGLIVIAVGLLGAAWAGNWGGIRDTLTSVWNGTIQPALSGLWQWLSVNIPNAVEWLRDKWDLVWNAISGIVQYATTQISTLLEAFQAAREGDWYTFGEKLREIWDTAWSAISSIAETVWNSLKEKFSGWIEDIKNFFTNTDWKATGQSILEGISNGITGYIETVKKNAEGVAIAIWDTIRGFFGIKSPATKMIEIGKALIEGLINGFIGGISEVTKSIGKLSKAFTDVDWLDIGEQIVGNINSGLSAGIQSVVSTAGSLCSQVSSKLLTYNWYNVGKSISSQIGGGISGNSTALSKAIGSLFGSASSDKSISYKAWTDVGAKIVSYIASGVSNNAGTLTGAINSLLSGAKTSAISVINNWPSTGSTITPPVTPIQPTGAMATASGAVVNVNLYANVGNNLDVEELTYKIASRLRSYL